MHCGRTLGCISIVAFLFILLPTANMLSTSLQRNSFRLLQRTVNARAVRPYSSFSPRLAASTTSGERFSITTPIYYVNGEPHLGHAYTSVLSDVIARYHRKLGKEVFFLSGTDEHGQKVQQSASAAGRTPDAFTNDVSCKFRDLMSLLHCSNDDFIRTTEDRHKQAVEHLWKVLEDSGQIYLGAYEGWYSIRDEAFYQQSELVDGKAPTGAEVTWVTEESYFFRLSQWTEKLIDLYQKHPEMLGPKGRTNEIMAMLTQPGGLKDLSISRTAFSWGIPVPGNPKHVVYVWLDALVNYISALGYPDTDQSRFQKFWPADIHIVGKDILRFHAIYWPAFLMAANLPLPKVCSCFVLCMSIVDVVVMIIGQWVSIENIRSWLVDKRRRENVEVVGQCGGAVCIGSQVRCGLRAILPRVRDSLWSRW